MTPDLPSDALPGAASGEVSLHGSATRVITRVDIPEVADVYLRHQNYEIIDYNEHDDRCFVYFSSHGLYYPNDSETFRRLILVANRFEWKKNLVPSARRVILLRDVQRHFYLEGINGSINSIDKLVDFLRLQTQGLRVICVGSSAGAYAAALVGTLLNASHVFSFSGYFSLWEPLRSDHPSLSKYEEDVEYNRYFSIVELMRSSRTPVFYFYPALCAIDAEQSRLVEDLANVYEFKFRSDRHGVECYPVTYVDLFGRSLEELTRLHRRYKGSVISPLRFSVGVSGVLKSLKYEARVRNRLGRMLATVKGAAKVPRTWVRGGVG
jgi:hypothetical protein